MDLVSISEYIENLEDIDQPELYGLHKNADIEYKKN